MKLPQALQSPLSRRMLAWTLSAVVVLTVAESAVQLYFAYKEDVGGIRQNVRQTLRHHLSSLALSVYRMDKEHLRAQMDALLEDPDIAYLAVWGRADLRDFKFEVGDRNLPHAIQQSYRLIHRLPAGQTLELGYLQVTINLTEARNRLWHNALVNLFSNGLTLSAVSLAILFLMHMGVTRHLHVMARHAAAIDLSRLDSTLNLRRFFRRQKPDEIDQVAWALNDLQLRLRDDIQQRVRMERRLQQAQKMESLGTLAGGVAHDINNVLGIILGQTELALATLPPGSAARDRLDLALQGVDRAKDIVQQILAFSRRTEVRRRPMDIGRAVKDSLNLLRATIPKSIDLSAEISPDCGHVEADPTEIQQVLMNLCTNAAQAMEDTGGALWVSLQSLFVGPEDAEAKVGAPPGAYALLTVRDTGHGMNRETLERIFEPYFTTKEIGKGTGLGLSVVHGIIAGLRGSITAYSTFGVGTTFRVFLPRVLEGVTDEVPPPGPESIPRGSERLLLVDDEEFLIQATGDSLQSLGYTVSRFTDSREALKAIEENPADFDCLVTDLAMPYLAGANLASAARNLRPDLPVVLCTGFSQRIDKAKALSLGVGAMVMKPILRSELARALRQVLDPSREVGKP